VNGGKEIREKKMRRRGYDKGEAARGGKKENRGCKRVKLLGKGEVISERRKETCSPF